MQVFCDLPNGARRMCTAYNAYTVVYMLTYIAMMWLYAGLHKLCYPTILLSGIGARGVSSEHMENMEMFCVKRKMHPWLYGYMELVLCMNAG